MKMADRLNARIEEGLGASGEPIFVTKSIQWGREIDADMTVTGLIDDFGEFWASLKFTDGSETVLKIEVFKELEITE